MHRNELKYFNDVCCDVLVLKYLQLYRKNNVGVIITFPLYNIYKLIIMH